MYPQFLDMGYKPSLFWELSLYEVYELIESYGRKQKAKAEEELNKIKTRIFMDSALARTIGDYMASLLNDKAKISTPAELFPNLFEDVVEAKVNDDIELHKARMEEFAYRHNKEFKRKED